MHRTPLILLLRVPQNLMWLSKLCPPMSKSNPPPPTHVNGWEPAVYMSCMSQNFRLFHVSNLSVRNFRIFLLMYTGSERSPLSPVGRRGPCVAAVTAGHRKTRPLHRSESQRSSRSFMTARGMTGRRAARTAAIGTFSGVLRTSLESWLLLSRKRSDSI